MSSADQSDQGNFSTGFTLGLFAGAAGYYLFGTEEGRKLRQKLIADWESTKEQMVAEGTLPSSNISLRDVARAVFQTTAKVESAVGTSIKSVSKQVKLPPVKPAKKDAHHKFKGT